MHEGCAAELMGRVARLRWSCPSRRGRRPPAPGPGHRQVARRGVVGPRQRGPAGPQVGPRGRIVTGPLDRHERPARRDPRRRPVPRTRRPARGDDARRPRRPRHQGREPRRRRRQPRLGTAFRRRRRAVADSGESTYFFSCNRNKESVTADLKSDDGKDLLTRLVRRADVLVENFRTGVLDRLGLPGRALHELNPRLVVLSITGFGHDGPEGGRAGYDQIAQGEAGLMSLTGPVRTTPARRRADRRPAGRHVRRLRGGGGAARARPHRRAAAWCAPRCWPRSSACTPSRAPATPSPARCPTARATTTRRSAPTACSTAPTACCRSPSAARACGSAWLPASACRSTARLRDQRGAGPQPRRGRCGRRRGLRDRTPLADLLPRLAEIGVPAGEVRTLDRVYDWDQTRSQGLLLDVEHATAGGITLPGPPLRFDAPQPASTPRRRRWASTTSPWSPGCRRPKARELLRAAPVPWT